MKILSDLKIIGVTTINSGLTVNTDGVDNWLTVQSSPATAGAGGLRWNQDSTYEFRSYATGTGTTTGVLHIKYVNASTGAIVSNPNGLKYEDGVIYHAGNFTPADKYDKTGGTISGAVTITGNLDVDGTIYNANDKITVEGNEIVFNNYQEASPAVYPSPSRGFKWNISSDGAGMRVFERGGDQLDYVFEMSDNVAGTDRYVWKETDWKGRHHDVEAMVLYPASSLTVRAPNSFFQGDIHVKGPELGVVKRASITNTEAFGNSTIVRGNQDKYNYVPAGSTLTMEVDASGYTGGGFNSYLIKIKDAVSTPNTFVWGINKSHGTDVNSATDWTAIDVAVSTTWVTLNNGIKVKFNATTGGVAGESFGFNVLPGGSLKVDNTTGTSYIKNNLALGKISATEALDVQGNIAVSGTVDGVDLSAFKTSFDTHTHPISEVTNLQTELDARVSKSTLLTFGSSSVKKVYNVGQYINLSSAATGTVKVTLPHSWSNTMMNVKIQGYDYTSNAGWQIFVSGYTYAGGTSWINERVYATGNPPFSTVRFGHDGTKCCLLLGTTTTGWVYPKIVVEEALITHSGVDLDWQSGWSLSLITAETGIAITGDQGFKSEEELVSTSSNHTLSGKIYINNTSDASLTTDGGLTIGNKAGLNIAIDDNEIMARNNGLSSILHLNVDGGDVNINGYKAWHAGNDGAGSGLDAGLFAGISPSKFVRNDSDQSISGSLTLTSSSDGILTLKQLGIAGTTPAKNAGWNYIQFMDSEGDRQGYMGINSGGDLIFNSEITQVVRIYDGTASRAVWHEGTLTPSDYVLKSGDTMTGQLNFGTLVGDNLRITSSAGVGFVQAGTSSTDTAAHLRISRFSTSATNIANFDVYSDASTFKGNVSVEGNITTTGNVDGVDVSQFKADYDVHTHDATTRQITQTSHGLAAGDVVRFDGTNYVKALADTAINAEVIGIVSGVVDVNTFKLFYGGYLTGLVGLTAGTVYYLSATTAGTLTATEPALSKPLLIAESTTSGYFNNFRGTEETDTSHTHAISDITNLQSTLDAKADLTDNEMVTGTWTFSNGISGSLKTDSAGSFEIELPKVGTPTISTSTTGGTLGAAVTRYYVVTAANDKGETTVSPEVNVTTGATGTTHSNTVSWSAIPGALSYRVYIGTASGTYTEYFVKYNYSFVDTGAAGTAGSPPSTNAARVLSLSAGESFLASDIVVQKNEPWLTLDSSSNNVTTAEQAAGISIGESGTRGGAALHLTYTGDGYAHIGMGAVSGSVPAYEAMKMHYQSRDVTFLGGTFVKGITKIGGANTTFGSATVTGDLNGHLEIASSSTVTPTTGLVFHHEGISTSVLKYYNSDNNTGYFNFVSDDSSFQGVKISGNTVWHAGNDGSGSGLDADLLDGLSSGQFLRSDITDTASGGIIIPKVGTVDGQSKAVGMSFTDDFLFEGEYIPHYSFGLRDSTYTRAYISGFYGVDIFTNGVRKVEIGSGIFKFDGNTVWHAGNDGVGSTLNADLLDGYDSADFPRKTEAATVGGGWTFTSSDLELPWHYFQGFSTGQNYIHLYPRTQHGTTGTASTTDIRAHNGTGLVRVAQITASGFSFDQTPKVGTTDVAIRNGSVQSNLNADAVDGYHIADLDTRYVNASGDTMSGTLEVAGDVHVQSSSSVKVGGASVAAAKFEMVYNSTTESLDFNFIG